MDPVWYAIGVVVVASVMFWAAFAIAICQRYYDDKFAEQEYDGSRSGAVTERMRRRSSVIAATGKKAAVGEVFIWWLPSCCDRCCGPPPAGTVPYTRWKRPNRRSCGLRFLDFVCDGFGLISASKSFYTWHTKQIQIYGWRFIAFQVSVNAAYGVATSFWYFFIPFYLDEYVGLDPVASGEVQAILNLAPILKPFMGLFTDNVRLFGSHRKSYFMATAWICAAGYVLLWQLPPSRQWATILLLVVNSFGYSWCGVVLYSMTAEKARLDPVEGAAILNTMQWGWYSLGGLLGDIIAGPWQAALGCIDAWILCAALFIVLGACGVLYEDEANIDKEFNDSCSSQMSKLGVCLNPFGVSRGVILGCICFVFLTWAVVPDVSYTTTYFFYLAPKDEDGLGFSVVFWGLISIIGDIALLVAAWIFGAFLTKTPLRLLFVVLQIFNTVTSLSDLALAASMHERFGIDARVLAPIGMFAYWLAWQLKMLPVYTLCAKIVPSGVEATLMSIISALNDLGGTVALYLGAFITARLGIVRPTPSEPIDFTNLPYLYLLRTILTAVPILFVVLVPSEQTINEVVQAVDAAATSVGSASFDADKTSGSDGPHATSKRSSSKSTATAKNDEKSALARPLTSDMDA